MNLIKKIARAKAARMMAELTEEYGDPRWQRLEFDSLEAAVEMNWEHRMPEALADTLAVLDAIATPGKAMRAAGARTILENAMRGNLLEVEVVATYRAMIAALRNEIEGEPT